jgi:hypothetical protein
VLISTIISCTGVALGVFVGHGRSQCIEDGTRGDILGGDEDDGFSLTLNLKFLDLVRTRSSAGVALRAYHNLSNFRVRLNQGLLQHLKSVSQYAPGGVVDHK